MVLGNLEKARVAHWYKSGSQWLLWFNAGVAGKCPPDSTSKAPGESLQEEKKTHGAETGNDHHLLAGFGRDRPLVLLPHR
jgi:hypothetical protein